MRRLRVSSLDDYVHRTCRLHRSRGRARLVTAAQRRERRIQRQPGRESARDIERYHRTIQFMKRLLQDVRERARRSVADVQQMRSNAVSLELLLDAFKQLGHVLRINLRRFRFRHLGECGDDE